MRIDRLSVQNFRGIKQAEIKGLSSSSFVAVGGKNGVGKTTLLEAVAILWFGVHDQNTRLGGPWSDECVIELDVTFEASEWDSMVSSAARLGYDHLGPQEVVTVRSRFRRVLGMNGWERAETQGEPSWAGLLLNRDFRYEHAFCNIDFLPSHRELGFSSTNIDPVVLSHGRINEIRENLRHSFRDYRNQVQIGSVESLLASLDYLDLISERESNEARNRYEAIVKSFANATGKTIPRPKIDRTKGVDVFVETPDGQTHPVSQLSSGEQQVLALMCYLVQIMAIGGIVLIDEPELHLHPALQRSLLSIADQVGQRSQIWIATHSPKLLALEASTTILHLVAPSRAEGNQLRPALKEPGRRVLLEELGLSPVDLMQYDALVFVEGQTDLRLRNLFPDQLGRASIYPAGGVKNLENVCRTLGDEGIPFPWICIRDRDFLSEDRVQNLIRELTHMFIWPGRTLENEFLNPQWISATLAGVGYTASDESVETTLREIADNEFEEVLARLIEYELNDSNHERGRKTGDPISDLKSRLQRSRVRLDQQCTEFADIEERLRSELHARWESDWSSLVQAKTVLRTFVNQSNTPFYKIEGLVSAMAAAWLDNPELGSPGVQELKQRLECLLSLDRQPLSD